MISTMKRQLTLAFLTCGGFLLANAQPAVDDEPEAGGKAIITIHTNLHSGFGAQNGTRGFALDRSYLGYQYTLKNGLEFKAVMDVGQSDDVNDYERIAYIKNAQVTWRHKGLTLSGGLISTTQFKTQESFWGLRYVMKSFQDEYKFGSSADMGISAAYRFTSWLSADVIVANGEGYKKLQVGDGLQYGAGVTLTPLKGLTLRGYVSYNEAADDEEAGITNWNVFAGYACKAFSLGAEYNSQTNAGHVNAHDQSGCSIYSTININKRIGIFGRWDYLTSKHGWNESGDGMAGVLGADFKFGRYIRLSPNVRVWSPKADGAGNECFAYINCSFSI